MDREKFNQYRRSWYWKHRDKVKAQNRRYYDSHKEQFRAYQKRYFEKNIALYREAGGCLRDARLARKMTQAELGKRIGVAPSTVCLWEQGKTPIPYADVLPVLPELLGGM